MCDLDVMGAQSKIRVLRKAATLARVRTTLLLNYTEKAARRKWNWTRSVGLITTFANQTGKGPRTFRGPKGKNKKKSNPRLTIKLFFGY